MDKASFKGKQENLETCTGFDLFNQQLVCLWNDAPFLLNIQQALRVEHAINKADAILMRMSKDKDVLNTLLLFS